MSGVGTGNLFRSGKRLFIATCRHVAEDYFHHNSQYVVLRGNDRIYSDQLELVSYTNEEIDIALIEIVGDHSSVMAYNLDDFEVISDFSDHSFEDTNLFICGCIPSHLRYEKEEGNYNVWISYMTLPDEDVSHTEDFVYARYQIGQEDNVTSDGLRTLLPNAPGLSGAFVLKVIPFDCSMPELWNPSVNSRIIAMQISWNKRMLCDIKFWRMKTSACYGAFVRLSVL